MANLNLLGIHDELGAGGAYLDGVHPRYGLKAVLRRMAGAILTSTVPVALSDLKAVDASSRADGMIVTLRGDQSQWQYVAASTLTGDDLLVATPTDNPSAGRWIRKDLIVDLKLAISFSTANNAVLYTVPTGLRLKPLASFWEPTADWTGGTSSAIGLNSSNAAASTAGDLLGGASGDVAAGMLAASGFTGTIGAKMATPGVVLVGGNTIKHNRITSAFTAGTGYAHVLVARVP